MKRILIEPTRHDTSLLANLVKLKAQHNAVVAENKKCHKALIIITNMLNNGYFLMARTKELAALLQELGYTVRDD